MMMLLFAVGSCASCNRMKNAQYPNPHDTHLAHQAIPSCLLVTGVVCHLKLLRMWNNRSFIRMGLDGQKCVTGSIRKLPRLGPCALGAPCSLCPKSRTKSSFRFITQTSTNTWLCGAGRIHICTQHHSLCS